MYPSQSESASPVAESNPEEVLKLSCPECSGILNIRRKHIGIAGKCVHCKTPVTAIELSPGNVALIGGQKTEPMPAQVTPAPVEAAVEAEPAQMEAPQTIPPEITPEPVSENFQEVESKVEGENGSDSQWGFPPSVDATTELDSSPVENMSDQTGSEFKEFVVPDLSSFAPTDSEAKENGSFEAVPPLENNAMEHNSVESLSSDAQNPVPGSSPFQTGSPLFAPPSESPLISPISEGANETKANAPVEDFGSISPFSTAPSGGEPGFAESLFGGSQSGNEGDQEPKPSSPFGSPLGAPPIQESAEEEEEVVLDGDGRPMKPMSEEEKAQFGKDMMKFGGYHDRSKWPKRILKFFMMIAVLAGLGYAAYVFLPEEQVMKIKDKVVNWLEPGSVFFDILPFEISSDSEGGEGGTKVRIKAIDGFNQLTDDFGAYMEAADDNLNSVLPEGAEKIPEREKAEKMEMPDIPKLPFKLPGSGGE
tara:strand:- start:3132 stop:4565 length:1434 start_codon:yes stop_codon:yes gene_type:complete